MPEKRICSYCGNEVFVPHCRTKQEKFFCTTECFKNFRKTNQYIKCEGFYKIVVNTAKYGIKEILIDEDDLLKAQKYHWYVQDEYATANIKENGKRNTIRLHRLVLNYFDKLYIDHINHNRLDNRKCNLRLVTGSQNQQNLTPKKDGYRGVYKSGDKFKAQIKVNGKDMYLGTFKLFEDAKKARIEAEQKYFIQNKINEVLQ